MSSKHQSYHWESEYYSHEESYSQPGHDHKTYQEIKSDYYYQILSSENSQDSERLPSSAKEEPQESGRGTQCPKARQLKEYSQKELYCQRNVSSSYDKTLSVGQSFSYLGGTMYPVSSDGQGKLLPNGGGSSSSWTIRGPLCRPRFWKFLLLVILLLMMAQFSLNILFYRNYNSLFYVNVTSAETLATFESRVRWVSSKLPWLHSTTGKPAAAVPLQHPSVIPSSLPIRAGEDGKTFTPMMMEKDSHVKDIIEKGQRTLSNEGGEGESGLGISIKRVEGILGLGQSGVAGVGGIGEKLKGEKEAVSKENRKGVEDVTGKEKDDKGNGKGVEKGKRSEKEIDKEKREKESEKEGKSGGLVSSKTEKSGEKTNLRVTSERMPAKAPSKVVGDSERKSDAKLVKISPLYKDSVKLPNVSHSVTGEQKRVLLSKEKARCPPVPPKLVGSVKIYRTVPTLEEQEKNRPELEPGGRFRPAECRARHRVAIIIPYRDRVQHLAMFIYHVHPILQRQQVDYAIYVVEQAGSGKFNRAMLMNVGALEALKQYPYDCFVFHDVDLLPEDDRNLYTCPEQPRHMSIAIDSMGYKLPYNDIFGGVSAMTAEQFRTVNGFSNKFWGWGGEDDDMSNRIKFHGFFISRYPANIGRYTMLSHKKDEPNPRRYHYLYDGKKRFKSDGLNSVKYRNLDLQLRRLYTWVYVDLFPS